MLKSSYKEGEKFNLTCDAKGVPTPGVTWYKDGKVFSGGGYITPGEYHYKIVFSGVDIEDQGNYTCVVFNLYGRLTYSYKFDVIGR